MRGGTVLLGGVVLALVMFAGRQGDAPEPAAAPAVQAAVEYDGDVWQITVYDDDPARGAAECRTREAEYAPAVCHVEPASSAPDTSRPGWAT